SLSSRCPPPPAPLPYTTLFRSGILTSWNGFLIGASRIIYAMAESGMLPRWFAYVHPRYRTPSHAVLVVGGLSVLSPLFGEQMLGWLVDAGGVNIVIAFLLVSISFLVLIGRAHV